ncbi:MAG: anion permease [Acidisphaera sp.]|nr:anion permease [Acidisphaera sp.]
MLLLQGDPVALKPLMEKAGLELLGAEELPSADGRDDELEAIEAVVGDGSLLIGQSAQNLSLRQRYEVNVLAVGRRGQRITDRLRRLRFRLGDTVVLQGRRSTLTDVLGQLGLLPLAERNLGLGERRPRLIPMIALAAAILPVALNAIPAEVAFFAAAVAVVLLRAVSPRQAYEAVDWPVIVMLGSLIPVGEAIRDTGAADIIARGLTVLASQLTPTFAVGLIMGTAIIVTPFLHHAAAVLVLGPVAAAVAAHLGFRPEAFLMAVALGASCDFLTPIGHQNNLLVMGPGGYRFADYWRLGLPLTCLVLSAGTALIVAVWPLR